MLTPLRQSVFYLWRLASRCCSSTYCSSRVRSLNTCASWYPSPARSRRFKACWAWETENMDSITAYEKRVVAVIFEWGSSGSIFCIKLGLGDKS